MFLLSAYQLHHNVQKMEKWRQTDPNQRSQARTEAPHPGPMIGDVWHAPTETEWDSESVLAEGVVAGEVEQHHEFPQMDEDDDVEEIEERDEEEDDDERDEGDYHLPVDDSDEL